MRFNTYINNAKCIEWGLNPNQGALFDLINQSAAWAQSVAIDGEIFYWISRNEVIRELPLFYSKSDTVYRHFVELDKKGLIKYLKVDGKDLVRLTNKGKSWNEFYSEINPNNSEINPKEDKELGNKSEKARTQPTVWVRLQFGSVKLVGNMVITALSSEAPTNDLVTFSAEFKVADASSVAITTS